MINLEIIMTVSMALISVSIVLVFVRLALGPSLPDRVVAFDLLASLSIGLIAIYAIMTRQPAILDVAIILALVAFLGTIGFAYYIERRTSK